MFFTESFDAEKAAFEREIKKLKGTMNSYGAYVGEDKGTADFPCSCQYGEVRKFTWL